MKSNSKKSPKLFLFGFVIIFFCFSSIYALKLTTIAVSESYYSKDEKVAKYLKFVIDDGRCEMAIAVISRSSGTKVMKNIRERFPSVIRCVGDLTLAKGTITEVNGCAAVFLSPLTKEIMPLIPMNYGGGINIIQNKNCFLAFNELLEQGPILNNHKVKNYLIGEAGLEALEGNLSGGTGADYEAETVLLYSKRKLYTDWYFQEKKRYEAELKLNYKKRKFNPLGAEDEIPKLPVIDEVMQ